MCAIPYHVQSTEFTTRTPVKLQKHYKVDELKLEAPELNFEDCGKRCEYLCFGFFNLNYIFRFLFKLENQNMIIFFYCKRKRLRTSREPLMDAVQQRWDAQIMSSTEEGRAEEGNKILHVQTYPALARD